MEKKWVFNPVEDHVAVKKLKSALAKGALYPEPLAKLLVGKGVKTFDEAKQFFCPDRKYLFDPYLMADMPKAVRRVTKAIRQEEKIMIYGDYDVDGTTSVSLMQLFFQDWGIPVSVYIPDRYKEGYGVSLQGVDYAKSEDCSLIIALDCGTKALDQISYARDLGIDFIVCDHHRPGETLPPVVALLNPKRQDCPYPDKSLSACGVGFKFAEALAGEFNRMPGMYPGTDDYDVLDRFADLVAVSIACDIVPVIGENRILAHYGLLKLSSNPLAGLKALMELAQETRSWDISDLVFFLGPRINSAGRLGTGRDAVKLLTGDKATASSMAAKLNQANADRKVLDKQILGEAIGELEPDHQRHSTVLFNENWHKGIIGIVASRLVERVYRPTILLTRSGNKWVGSGRSVRGFDLYQALEQCADLLLQFGGHKYAAGLTIDETQLKPFQQKFDAVVAANLTPEQTVPTLEIVSNLEFGYINSRFIRLIKRFAPFGPGNMEPVFCTKSVTVKDYRILKEDHIRFHLEQGGISFTGIGFGLAEKWLKDQAGCIDVAFQPDFNHWNGKTSIQLKIKDFKTTAST